MAELTATHSCKHCGDPVARAEGGHWVHTRSRGSVLIRCQHTVPYGYDAEPGDPLPGRCPDGGKCHHGCTTGCWRVSYCGPLSGVYPGDRWPADVRDAHAETDGTL